MMNEKLMQYLDGVFLPYKDLYIVKELKEEVYTDLIEKLKDLKNQGFDDETAYDMTINSLGDIKEIIESIGDHTRELKNIVKRDVSMTNLQDADLKGVVVPESKFNYSALKGIDFTGADLSKSSFKSSDLRQAAFDGANLQDANFITCALKGSTFRNCNLENTSFDASDLSDACFDDLMLDGTIFKKSNLTGSSFKNSILQNVSFYKMGKKSFRNATFDGARMDKLTYAILKGYGIDLANVTLI